MESKSKPEMIYRFLGKSGIKVSCLGFGNWVNNENPSKEVEEVTYQCMKKCIDNGINYFDTAEIYGFGTAETAMGNCLKRLGVPRKDFVLSTKVFTCGPQVNDLFLSRKHIIEGFNASLKRLQLDYADVAFAHRYDQETPIEEVCRGFNHLIESGKTFYWGTSEWTPTQIMEAMECCERHDLIKPIVEQPEYNLLMRKNVEVDLEPIFDKCGYGTTIFSPLAGGLLTGKYNKEMPKDGRYNKLDPALNQMILSKYEKGSHEELMKKLVAFTALADSLKVSSAQLAIAWTIKNRDVSVCLFGASKPEQVDDNVKSLNLVKVWSPDIEKKIDEIFNSKPEPLLNWRTWKPMQCRREKSVRFDKDDEFKQ
jgi:voltage-dependent potassium channel beta subunit